MGVYSTSLMRPGTVHVHKLPLREFQEADLALRSNSSTPMPSFRPRSNSMSSLSSSGDTTRPSSRPCTGGGSCQDLGRPDLCTAAEAVRPLSRHELKQQNRDAVDWFRASHAINYHSRSLEETEAILAATRERRSSGIVRRCSKVEKVDDLDVE